MIEINNVSKSFIKTNESHKKVKFLADENISIKINEGEIVGILGPNGAGKTTLLRMIAGIMTPDTGTILIDNMNYKKNSITIKHNIAYLSGNTKLYQDITGYELLTMCGKYYGMKKDEINKQIDIIINKFDLSSFINQKIGKLSTGQLQRINIARCIIHNPKYYILDEATSGLDILSSKVILDFIKEQKELGKGIIYSTHYMEEAENICDIVYLIHKGKIVSVGKPTDIINKTNTTNLRDAFFAIIGDNHE